MEVITWCHCEKTPELPCTTGHMTNGVSHGLHNFVQKKKFFLGLDSGGA